jgi:histidine kinase
LKYKLPAIGQIPSIMSSEQKYVEEEVLFSSVNTIIVKAKRTTDNLRVIIKKPAETFPSVSTVESFKKDFQFAKMLYDTNSEYFVNMMEMLEQPNGSVFLVEEEDGNEGLQNFKSSTFLDPKEFLKLAIDMCIALHLTHSKQIIHRDIKLGNFIFSQKNSKPKLIDFGLSVMVSRKSPSVSCSHPVGTYGYMSPEQTGRISKNIDFRSDIYSLGITFYQLLTGELPFNGDNMAIVHSHITKKLPNISNTPKVLNEVIQKMCSKNPSERYNSAIGVWKDLEFLLQNFESIPKDFEIAKQDVKEFQIPNKLYGRKEDLLNLRETINENSQSNMCLISGYSGMGKSKLIEEMFKDQRLKFLVSYGKFDQFNRLTPYSAFLSYDYSFN